MKGARPGTSGMGRDEAPSTQFTRLVLPFPSSPRHLVPLLDESLSTPLPYISLVLESLNHSCSPTQPPRPSRTVSARSYESSPLATTAHMRTHHQAINRAQRKTCSKHSNPQRPRGIKSTYLRYVYARPTGVGTPDASPQPPKHFRQPGCTLPTSLASLLTNAPATISISISQVSSISAEH